MARPLPPQPESTGIESFAGGFAIAAYLTLALAAYARHAGWTEDVAAFRVLFLGLEFAAAGVTTATVALALGPNRGPASRLAWCAGGASLLLVIVTAIWVLPRLFQADALL